MIFYCHIVSSDTWIEDISGEEFCEAINVSESPFGFGDVVYVGF